MRYKSIGIDYGSKMAGTTVIAALSDKHSVIVSPSQKNKDADLHILDFMKECQYEGEIYLDAPISLPGVYRELEGYEDYFYREADRAVGAMSPMFLGGLTARAMRLKRLLNKKNIEIIEAYPKLIAERLSLQKLQYKKDKSAIAPIKSLIEEAVNVKLPSLQNWHEVDAILALSTGLMKGIKGYGNPEEGMIYG